MNKAASIKFRLWEHFRRGVEDKFCSLERRGFYEESRKKGIQEEEVYLCRVLRFSGKPLKRLWECCWS
jgi:hypothetical protein